MRKMKKKQPRGPIHRQAERPRAASQSAAPIRIYSCSYRCVGKETSANKTRQHCITSINDNNPIGKLVVIANAEDVGVPLFESASSVVVGNWVYSSRFIITLGVGVEVVGVPGGPAGLLEPSVISELTS